MLFGVHVTYKHHRDIQVNVCFVTRRFAPFEVLSTVTHTLTLTPGGEKHRQRLPLLDDLLWGDEKAIKGYR